jgi:hypothetical protein
MLSPKLGFLIFLLFPLFVFSQANESKEVKTNSNDSKDAFIGISAGFSFPMGSFSASNTEFDNSAFAKQGFNIHLIDAGFKIGKTLGASAYYFNSTNNINLEKLAQYRDVDHTLNYVDSKSGNYEIRGLLLGVLISKPNEIVDIDLKFLFGNASIYIPQTSLTYRNSVNNEIENYVFSPTNKNGFGVGLTGGVRIHLNQYIDLMVNGNYLIFKNEFERIVQLSTNNTATSSYTEVSEITFEVFNLNFGLAFRFLKSNR